MDIKKKAGQFSLAADKGVWVKPIDFHTHDNQKMV